MKRPFEVVQLYKAETSNRPNEYEVTARVGKFGDVILDGDECEAIGIKTKAADFGELDIIDPDYVHWLENKVLELIKK